MDKIQSLLKTPEGAAALKIKLQAMSKKEKNKPQFKNIWLLVCRTVNAYKIKERNLKQKAQQEEEKKAAIKQQNLRKLQSSCLTKQEVNAGIQRLESLYPKLFNQKKPQPIKIGITDDILNSSGWENPKLLSLAITKYANSALYNLALIQQSHRYTLSGEKEGAITSDEKNHAIERLNNTLGRFVMQKKHPDLLYTQHKTTPQALREEFYGKHYLDGQLYREVWLTLTGCYGKRN